GTEAVNNHTGIACLVVKLHTPHDKFVTILLHPGFYQTRCPRRLQEQNLVEADRQLQPRLPPLDSSSAGGEDLQGAVKKNRVQAILSRAKCHLLGERDPPRRPAVTGGQLPNRSEFLSVAEAQVAQVVIEAADFDRGQRCA